MGLPIARNLLAAGFPLTVYNRTGGKADPLVARGAVQAGSPAEAAARARIVITMVADDRALDAVATGPRGLLAGMEPGEYDEPDGFHRKPALRRFIILLAGPMANFLVAALITTGALLAQLNAAHAQVELARVNLENTQVRAPFDGTVLRKDAEVGEIVAPASAGGGLTRTAIVTMADLGSLEVEVDVNEAYIARVSGGQRARITLDAYPDTAFQGRVRQVVPTADRQRATVQVKVAILDHDPRILPEMGAKVEFLADAAPAAATVGPRRVTVPAAAVRSESGRAVVWVVRNGRLERRDVDAGPVSGNLREIRSGLSGGEVLLVGGLETPRAGQRVRVTP